MVIDIQFKRESQLLHYYQWRRGENLVNLSVLRANARVYVVFLSFKWKPGELYVQYMSRVRGQTTCPTLHCFLQWARTSAYQGRQWQPPSVHLWAHWILPSHDEWTKIEHNTGNYVPYSFWLVCGFFNVPQSYMWKREIFLTLGWKTWKEKM